MTRQVFLTATEQDGLCVLGRRIRRARLRRNITQEEFATSIGVTRKTIVALEAGSSGTSLGVLAKAMVILGYPERIQDLLATDVLGEDIEEAIGRKKAGRRQDVAAF